MTCSEGEACVMAGTVMGRGRALGHREFESFVLHLEKKTWRRGVERCDAKSFWAGIAVGIGWPGEKWSRQPWQLSHWILPTSPKIETHNLFTCIRFLAKFVKIRIGILFYQESKLMIHSDCRLCCSRRLIWCDPEQIKNTTHIVNTLYCVFV